MAPDAFEVFTILPTTPEEVYAAWLDSEEHSKFTGEVATIDPAPGGKFTVWNGYIAGTTLESEPARRILQAWRTTEFGASDPDSLLEILIEPLGGGTRLTLRHSNIPSGQGAAYQEGWQHHYFVPMAAYFGQAPAREEAPAKSRAPARKKATKKLAVKAKSAVKTARKARRARGAKPAKKAAAKKKPIRKSR
jgi:uncharacterized protein YndB with AHSA1/START domain